MWGFEPESCNKCHTLFFVNCIKMIKFLKVISLEFGKSQFIMFGKCLGCWTDSHFLLIGILDMGN